MTTSRPAHHLRGQFPNRGAAFPFGEHTSDPINVGVVKGKRVCADDRKRFFYRRARICEWLRLEDDFRTALQDVRFARG
jgi:hypothetical protein